MQPLADLHVIAQDHITASQNVAEEYRRWQISKNGLVVLIVRAPNPLLGSWATFQVFAVNDIHLVVIGDFNRMVIDQSNLELVST
ncbi:hypothetical protein D3C78_1880250 [compost metagenome]